MLPHLLSTEHIVDLFTLHSRPRCHLVFGRRLRTAKHVEVDDCKPASRSGIHTGKNCKPIYYIQSLMRSLEGLRTLGKRAWMKERYCRRGEKIRTSAHICLQTTSLLWSRPPCMHRCLSILEIVSLVCEDLAVDSSSRAGYTALVNLATTCHFMYEPSMNSLWYGLFNMVPLLRCFPEDLWEPDPSAVHARQFVRSSPIHFRQYVLVHR